VIIYLFFGWVAYSTLQEFPPCSWVWLWFTFCWRGWLWFTFCWRGLYIALFISFGISPSRSPDIFFSGGCIRRIVLGCLLLVLYLIVWDRGLLAPFFNHFWRIVWLGGWVGWRLLLFIIALWGCGGLAGGCGCWPTGRCFLCWILHLRRRGTSRFWTRPRPRGVPWGGRALFRPTNAGWGLRGDGGGGC